MLIGNLKPSTRGCEFPRMLIVMLIVVAVVAVRVDIANGLANCPPGCQCDDNTLIVQCGEGQLDVLPIALNPSIQRLVIKSNKIKTIDSSIQFYAELTFLDLSSNHLMTIPQRTFAYQKKLQEIHLNHNKIGQISNKTFIGLSAVAVLNLRGNLISELHQGTFSPLIKMEELNIGENRIRYIDPKAFDGLTQLRILYLDDNELTSVPDPVIFQAMPALAELFVGMNTLETVPSGAFQDVKGLTRLDLRGAGLRNISHDSFRGLEALHILDLSDNRLPRIPTLALSNLARLEELSLGQNDFEIILEGAFVGLKNLKRLDVSGALALKRVMNGAFSANTNLEYLNLSMNRMLSEVQEGSLSGLPHLRHVILKANGLTTLAEGLFPWKDLITLDLSENPMACDCRVMWLRNLLLARNGSNDDGMAEVLCEFPERLRGEALKNLNLTLMGCSHTDPRKQALIGALLVGSAATITALALIIYRCRRKIREYLKGGFWGSSALGRKEREYQKTFCDEDYMTRHQHHPCNLGIHSSFSNTYTPHRPHAASAGNYQYGMCTLPINDLSGGGGGGGIVGGDTEHQQQKFQQLRVPTATMMSEKKAYKIGGGGGGGCDGGGSSIDDSASFVMHMTANKNTSNAAVQKMNHYTKPQFLSSATATVGDSCYSYTEVPMVHHGPGTSGSSGTNGGGGYQHQLRLTQEHFKRQQQQQQQQQSQSQSQSLNSATLHDYNQPHHHNHNIHHHEQCDANNSDVLDPNYIYSNAHYSMPLEQPGMGCRKTPTPPPPPLPPALPQRNGGGGGGSSTTGRRSYGNNNNNNNKQQQQQQQQQSKINNHLNTLHSFH